MLLVGNTLSDPCLPNPLPLSIDRTCDLYLTNKICQMWQNIISMSKLDKIITSILLADSLCCPLGLYTVMKQEAMMERSTWQVIANSQLGTETFNLTALLKNEFCQFFHLEVSPPSVKLSDEISALTDILLAASWETLSQRSQRSHAQTLQPQKLYNNEYVV